MENWIDDVEANDIEKKDLFKWINIIGHNKYKEYYELVKANFIEDKVQFERLRECAIYDMKVSIQIFNILRIIELNFRAMVEKQVDFSKQEDWIKHINKKSRKRKQLIEDFKARKADTHFLLGEVDFDELRKIMNHFHLLKERKRDLIKLQSFRNKIMHHKVILSNDNEEIVNDIVNSLSFIEDADIRKKKSKEIDTLIYYDKGVVQDYKIRIGEN